MIKVDPETRYMSLAVCEFDRPGLGPLWLQPVVMGQ